MRTIQIYSLDIGTVSSYAAGEVLVERGKLTSLPIWHLKQTTCFATVMVTMMMVIVVSLTAHTWCQ